MVPRPLRVRLAALALTAALLAGCFTSTTPPQEEQPDARLPRVACPDPCLRPIDSGIRWEPSVAVNPKDPLHIVASSMDQAQDRLYPGTESWGLSHVTFDGGATWQTVRLPGGPSAGPAHPLYRFDRMDDSMVAFLPDGTLLWSAIVNNRAANAVDSGASLVVLRSLDGGLTFPEVPLLIEGKSAIPRGAGGVAYEFHDKQWFAIAPDGAALLVWNVNYVGHPKCGFPDPTDECTEVVFSRSTDGGKTWSAPGIIHKDGVFSGAFPLIRGDGGWVVSFRDTQERTAHVALSTDEGATWKVSDAIDFTTKFPVLTATRGPSGERLYMAYPQSEENHDGAQVVSLRWSDDGGATWSDALPLHAPEHPGRTNPAIAPLGEDGVVVTFFHPGKDTAEYRAVLYQNGSLSEPLVLDTHDGSPEGVTRHTGDYMGLAPLPDGSAFAVWNAMHGDAFTVTGARLVSG